jgi:hypothetical protein
VTEVGEKPVRHVPTACPWCGEMHDAATAVGHDAAPKPGDLTICADRGEWSFYTAGNGRRRPTDGEFVWIGEDLHCRMLKAWCRFNAERCRR